MLFVCAIFPMYTMTRVVELNCYTSKDLPEEVLSDVL